MKYFSVSSAAQVWLVVVLLFAPLQPALAGSPVVAAPISQGQEQATEEQPNRLRIRDRFQAPKNRVATRVLSRLAQRDANPGRTGLLLVLLGLGLIALGFVIPAATIWLLGLGLLSTLIGIFMGLGGIFGKSGTKEDGSTDNSGKVAGSVAAGLGITAVVLLVLLGIGVIATVLLITALVLGFIDGL